MAHGAAGRCAEKRMMASDVPHDGPSGRPCQTSRLCTRRDAQTEANRGMIKNFLMALRLSKAVQVPVRNKLSPDEGVP